MNKPTTFLQELIVRAPEIEDATVMLSFENDEELSPYGAGTGLYSRYQLEEYVRTSQNDVFADGAMRWLVEHKSEGVVAVVDVVRYDVRHNRAEVGIAVRRDCRRQGVAAFALARLEEHCFEHLGFRQLFAYVFADNIASIRLFTACGYVQTAHLKQWQRVGRLYKDVLVFQKLNL